MDEIEAAASGLPLPSVIVCAVAVCDLRILRERAFAGGRRRLQWQTNLPEMPGVQGDGQGSVQQAVGHGERHKSHAVMPGTYAIHEDLA